jgi:hypothetical protein
MICAFVCLHSIGVLEFELGGPHNKSSAHAGRPARALLACIMLVNNSQGAWVDGFGDRLFCRLVETIFVFLIVFK